MECFTELIEVNLGVKQNFIEISALIYIPP